MIKRNRTFLLGGIICFSLFSCLRFCEKERDLSKISYLSPLKKLGPDSLILVFTSSLEGSVEPCGCTSNPLGGIARMTQVFNDAKTISNGNVLLIDTGNLIFDTMNKLDVDKCQDEKRISLLLSNLSKMKLQFTVPGPLDDARGASYRDEFYNKYKINTIYFEPKIIEYEDYNIAFLAADENTKDKEKIISLAKSLKFKEKPCLIVVISQMPIEQSRSTFTDMGYIDIVIQGRLVETVPHSLQRMGENGPLLVLGSRMGQYFTALVLQNMAKLKKERLEVDDRAFIRDENIDLLRSRIENLKKQIIPGSKKDFIEERIKHYKEKLHSLERKIDENNGLNGPNVIFYTLALTRHIEANEDVNSELKAYERSIPQLIKECEGNTICEKAKTDEASFVGVETCKVCHQGPYQVWKDAIYPTKALSENGKEIIRDVGHSKAWQTLKEAHKESDRSCVACHSIGFMKKGGFCKVEEVDFRVNVQCEACHGPGSLHAKTTKKEFIKRQMTEDGCRSCHHVPHIQKFDSFNYVEGLKKILGPGHGEKLLKQLKHSKNDLH